jgi:cAMP-binding proteins - catabolite gene activator and regulatory subunit of cAMP-dependent protein kinases
VPSQDAAVIERYAKIGKLLAGEHFLMPGKVCNKVGFLLSGVFRVYVINENGKEVIRGFPAENHFMIDLKSFNQQQISIEYWEALTEVEYIFWTIDDVLKMEKEINCWQSILIPMSHHILVTESHERIEMLSDDAKSRYVKFCDRYPHIVSRVPLRLIARYLGIAPQTLSRIRQQLAKRSISSQMLTTR